MFSVNGNPIVANELDILMELRAQLALNNIKLFREFRQSGYNIQFNCPSHNAGQERKPSCGISTVDAKRNGVVVPAGTVHCFTCGYTATLEEMVSHCFGKDDQGTFGRAWLTKNFLTVSVENRGDIALDLQRNTREKRDKYISEQELDSYRYYHDYMYKRKLTNEIIEMFDVGYDPHFELVDKFGKVKRVLQCVTFPVRDITGGTLFIARRSVTDKFFHYPEGVDKPVYGLYELMKYAPDAAEVVICESIFNALTSWVYGKPAVALLGLGTEEQYAQLEKLPCRKFITGLDPDEAGQRATDKLFSKLRGKKLLSRYAIPAEQDINDLTKEQFLALEEFF